MGTFLKLLEIELSSLDQSDFYEPDAELESDDHIAGDMSEDAVRLFTLMRQTTKFLAEKVMEIKFGRLSSDESNLLKTQVEELHSKSDFIKELFWIEIRSEYNLWDKGGLGVRVGRKVVWFESKTQTTLGDLLRGLGKG